MHVHTDMHTKILLHYTQQKLTKNAIIAGMCTSSDHFLSSMDSDAQFQSEMVPKLGEIKSKIGIP